MSSSIFSSLLLWVKKNSEFSTMFNESQKPTAMVGSPVFCNFLTDKAALQATQLEQLKDGVIVNSISPLHYHSPAFLDFLVEIIKKQ